MLVKDIANLHCDLLPESPISELGLNFAENFYYTKLRENGLIKPMVYYCDNQPVAFACYTLNPSCFMRDGFMKNKQAFIRAISSSIIEKPSRLGTLLKVVSLGNARLEKEDENVAELLSFGVLPAYNTVRNSIDGKFITNHLMDAVIAECLQKQIREIQMVIRENNKPSLIFFASYGSTIIPSPLAKKGMVLMRFKI